MCSEQVIEVSISGQTLNLVENQSVLMSYPVSTAKNGTGQVFNSECTPLGHHRVRAKIGALAPKNAVFIGRRFTGEIFAESMKSEFPDRDWILSRILWLSGEEKGLNQGGEVDTFRRYIYIHGCPESDSFDEPLSHGCIKMRNKDVVELFDLVPVGISVYIKE